MSRRTKKDKLKAEKRRSEAYSLDDIEHSVTKPTKVAKKSKLWIHSKENQNYLKNDLLKTGIITGFLTVLLIGIYFYLR